MQQKAMTDKKLKVLHTSDWHLGRLLYGQKRYKEFELFLNWLIQFIDQQKIDILLVAGDIFDTTTPGNRSQELYYNFLFRLTTTCCRHVVITGGNHDSPTFLDAPGQLLKAMNIHVIGEMCSNIDDEVLTLLDPAGKPEAIIGAVPFLRDRDIRNVDAGETIDDKSKKLTDGLIGHYNQVASLANQRLDGLNGIPVIGMGHLFTSSERKDEGDGVRELYVGTLAYLDSTLFPKEFDYIALGHLHIARKVGGNEHIRYSGSPIPMGFNEASQSKKVVMIEFSGRVPSVQEYTVPLFQVLYRIQGTLNEILNQITELKNQRKAAWLEIELTGNELVPDLTEQINALLEGSDLEALLIKNRNIEYQVLTAATENETLETMDPEEVFVRCLESNEVPEENRQDLLLCYKEIVAKLSETDFNA